MATDQSETPVFSPRAFWLPVAILLLLVVAFAIYAEFVVPGLRKIESIERHSRWMMLWAAVCVVSSTALICNAVLALRFFYGHWRTNSSAIELPVLCYLLLVLVVVWDATTIDFGAGLPNVLQYKVMYLGEISAANKVQDGLAVTTIVFTALCCAVLAGVSRSASLAELRVCQRQLHILMWTSSAVLAIGILQVSFLHQWGAAQVCEPCREKCSFCPELDMANAIAMTFGLLASAIACVIFLPVAMLQANRQEALVQHEVLVNKRKRKDVLEEFGFEDLSAAQHLMRQMAILAPLATGVLARAFG